MATETLAERTKRVLDQNASVDAREQGVIDRHTSTVPSDGLANRTAKAMAQMEIEARRNQRAYAEAQPSPVAKSTYDPTKYMLENLGDRQTVLETIRIMTPEQRAEALKLAPGIAQQLGDDRGGGVARTLGALSRGVSHMVTQPVMELTGLGGTPEEIAYIRQLDAAASQEFNPALPSDPWYERGPLQATEMAPWMATIVGAGGLGRAGATALAETAGGRAVGGAIGRVAAQGGAKGAIEGTVAQGGARAAIAAQGGEAGLAAGSRLLPGLTAGRAGELAGITAAAFPGQYAQEVDQLKAIGMHDDAKLRLLAGGTAAVVGLIEGLVPNPFKSGQVPMTEGAVKAARQYLWEATKRAPAEMSEEYLQGVTSGLGQWVAKYIDANSQDKTIADAFALGWEQTKEAALPMAFLLGVPASVGAGRAALQANTATQQRLALLEDIRAKGFVSMNDAKNLNIEGKNRKERLANTEKEIEALKNPSPWNDEFLAAENARLAAEQGQPPSTPTADPATLERSPLPSTPPSGTATQSGATLPGGEAGAAVAGIGKGLVEGLYTSMYERLQAGKYPGIAKNPSDDAVAAEHARQPFQTPEEIRQFINDGSRPVNLSYEDEFPQEQPSPAEVTQEEAAKLMQERIAQRRAGQSQAPVSPAPQAESTPSPSQPTEQPKQPAVKTDWKLNDRVLIPVGVAGKPKSVGTIVSGSISSDYVTVAIDGGGGSIRVKKEELQLPDAKFEAGEQVLVPWVKGKDNATATITKALPDGTYEVMFSSGRFASQRGDQMIKLEQTTAPVPQQPKGGDPTVTDAEQVPPSTSPKPVRVYHGTDAESFTQFDDAKIGSSTDSGLLGAGHYFSTDADGMKRNKKTLVTADISLSNPLKLSMPDFKTDKNALANKAIGTTGLVGKELSDAIKAKGFDGVELDYSPTGYAHKEYAVYDSAGVKVAKPEPAVDAQSKGTAATPTGATVDPVAELDQAEDELAGLLGETTGEDVQASGDVQELPQPKHPDEVDALPKDSLYRTTAGGKKFIAVRGEGKRGGGDRLFETVEAANAHIERQKIIDQQNEEVRKKREEREATESKKEADYVASFQGFKQDNPREFGRARKVLDTQRNYRDKVQTRKQIIEQSVADGAKVLDGRLERPDGTSLGEDAITKIGIQYAEHLIAARLRSDAAKADLRGDSEMSEALNRQADRLSNPESKWQSETRAKLDAVPALKGSKFDMDEEAGTVKVTRPDGLKATIHFNADEELAKAAIAKGKKPESIHGRAVRRSETEFDIYVRSDANHTNILNHEVMHWLEFNGVVTKEEVEKYGGREAIAEKYGKWAEVKLRKKDSVFQRIYDALEAVFSSQRKFFEEVGESLSQDKKPSAETAKGGKPKTSTIVDKTPSVPSYRDWRFNSTARNAGKIVPNKVGAKFLPDQMQAISDWAKSEGYSVSNVLPTGININDPSGNRLDIASAGAAGVKAEASKAASERRQANERKADEDRKAKADGRKSAAWIANVFGSDAMNDYNRNALSDYLEGDTKKFEGMVSEKWREGLKSLKALSEEGKIDWKRVLDAYDLDSKNAPAQPSADQVNVDSGAESKVKSEDADLEAMIDAEFDAQLGTKNEPAKKSTGKKKSPSTKPKTRIRKAADNARQEADDLWAELNKESKDKLTTGLDPDLAKLAVRVALAEIKAGTLSFAAFVEQTVAKVPADMLDKLKPYMEMAWKVAHKRGMTDDPAGKFDDILAKKSNDYGTVETPNRVELGKYFASQLSNGKSYSSIIEARKEAAALITGDSKSSIEPGTPAAKAIDEAVEQGVVRAAREIAESSSDPLKVFDDLLDLYERQPRLAVRTGTSMREQAYSTPAPAAWVASILSDTSRGNTAYDSSAGNGMLLLGVDAENAIANELNPDRAQALRELGYQVHEGDATTYTPDRQPDRIIINPPFGELEGQSWTIDGTTTDKIDHAIVLKTLESLPEDGKAVLIIGSKGFEQRKPKDELRRGEAYKNDKNFYNALYDGYNVTDHFTLHGDLYAKQGAAFPIDVIVIDGRGESALPKPYQIDRQNAIPRVINSWKELRDVGERYLDTGSGRPSDLSTEPVGDDMAGLSSLLEGQGERTGGKGGRSGKNTGGRGGVPSGGTDNTQQPRGDSGSSSVSGAPDQQGASGAERLPDDNQSGSTARPDGGNDAKKLDREADVGSEDGLQLPYSQRSSARNVGTLVPATHARAVQEALEKAELRYGNLDKFVAKELGYKPSELMNYFSAEQIDALALNIARHKEGKAFVLGDQTGVGKGRVAAATMVYAKRQGLVPVFMTQSPDLFADMYRDLQDIGQHSEGEPFYALATNTLTGKDKIELPDGTMITQTADFAKDTINEVARNVANDLGPIAIITVQKTTDADGNPLGTTPTGRPRVRSVQEQREYDAVFSTYSQMQTVGGDTKDRHTAMSIIASKSFFVLDESHNAGGVKARSGGRGNENESADAVGRAARLRELVSESQGVLFLSATYAKNPDVMDLYAKTGMADAVEGGDEALIETINKGGIPLQQVLSEMLVESGAYMRREKSFDGIEFSAVVKETGREEAGEIAGIFDSINTLDKIKNDIVKADEFRRWLTANGFGLGKDSATGRRGMESSTFSSIVHNLVDQMLLSVKADAVADEAIASLERGESPVIALSNTAGAALDNYLAEFPAEVGDEIEFGFNSTAYRYLERSREITLTDVDASGKRTSRRVRLPDDVLGPDGVQAYNAAKALIDSFAADIPASPIDHIRNRLEKAGYKVAEITGRDMMVDYSGSQMRLARRPSSEQGKSGKLASVRGYNSGEIDALILNQSGSTGLSAHASDKFINQKRRIMIVAQADKNIDTFMQMLGRINRTGQVEQHKGQPKGSNLPRYMLLMTDVPAEIRPASVLIKKLSSLNANVTADSKGSVSFDAPDILNKVGDRVVAEYVADNPALNHALDDIVEVNAEGSPKVFPDIARKVSGRMAMRPIPEQQAFWDAVTETYAEEIEQLNKLGKNPLAATKLDLGARTLERVEIFSGDTTADSPFLQPAYADRALVKKQGEPMTPDEIKTAINQFYGLRTKRKRGPDPFGDMAAEMFRESMTGKDAPQNVTVSQPNLRQAITSWSSEQIAKAEEAISEKSEQQIARLVNQEAIDRVRSRASTIETTIRRRLNSIAPGMAVTVSEALEEGRYSEPITGVVIDVKAKKGNEHLPSGWIATIAISSPDRVVRVPFSRIETAAQAGDMYVAPMFEVAGDLTYAEWEEIGDVYEERVIGTGNVLAAFDKLVSEGDRGNIVFFTNEEGVSQRGVLMPRSFNFDRWAEKRPATFKTPEQVFEFINLEQGQLNHQANDPNFAIQFVMDGQTMLVRSPRSRQRSGKYTTNQELIAASGTDFVSVGQILQMKVRGKQQQLAVIKAALKLGPLVAANFKEDAKAVISRLPATQDASTKTKLQQAAEKANQELSNAVDEFGNVIKGKLGMNLPLNPEVIAAAAKVVTKAIEAGVRNFAELMERMVTKYGEKMAKRMEAALQQEWDKQVNARPYSEDGTPPTSPQPHPELVPPEPIPMTSVKNAIVDELRIQRGETPMPDVTPQTVQQWLEVAGNRIANDPYAGNTLVEQLLTGGKTSVDEMEGMVLQYHYRAVNNLFVEADIKLRQAKANGDPALIATAQDEARVIMRRLTAVETALDKAGTAWGRAGVSRQIFLKQDFSLASMVRRARVANGGNELSDEQVAKISEQAKQIDEMQKRIAELEAKTAEQEQAKVIDEAIKKDIENIQSPPVKPKSKMRLKAEERVASALAMFGAAAKGKLYTNPIDPEVLIPAIEVVKAYFDLGVVTFREFMSTIAKNIGAKEAKASKAIFRTAWDQLQTAGALSQPDLDLTNPGKLTRFARSVQRTLIENGIREREEIVDGVHEALQEIIPDITRRQAMDALSSYGQFSQLSKDPIDQIMRDINGQLQQLAKLEDMEQGIAPAKTGVERRLLSDEERRLAQMVNEATRRGGFVVTDPETQLKSAMAAAKTAVRNRIADMNFELTPKPDGTYSRIVRGKTELIPDAELEQLRKDRDALQQVHKAMFPPKGATQAQKIASASRALDAAIASLEAKLAVGDISPAPQPPPLSTPELDAKRARLKALNEQRDALRKIANPGMTAEQIKIRSLNKSIAELEKQLATGNFAPNPKPAPLTSPEINARQAKLEELRATKKAILAAANPKMTPEQRARKAYEASLRKQLAMYSEKIAQGDFAPAPKKSPRILTNAELDLKKQLADIKHDFFEALSKYHLANLSPAGRAIDIVRESAHLSRAIMTSVDLSAVLRQGGLGVYSHPKMARKAAAEMWNAIWSRQAEFQSMEKLRTRPNAQLYEESGLNITDSEGKLSRQEEAFMGRWARTGIDFLGGKVQAGSKLALEPVAASARAYVTFINNLRADLFDVMVENLGRSGQVTKEEARLIATYVNAATGRADLKALNEKAAALNTVFFAPRYVASRFQYLAMPLYLLGSKDSIRVKKLIAKEYARTFTGAAVFIASLTALSYLAYLASGDDDEKPSLEINPLSADFFKPKIGETRIDPLAGLAQVIVFSSRMLSFHTKSSETGKIKRFYEGGPYETTHGSEAWRFMRTKLAPVPGAAVTAMSGMKDVVGDPVTPAGLVGGLFVPISLGEVYSTMRHRGIPKGTALTVLNIMGASVNTYGPKTAYLDATPEERAKQVNDYIKYMNWESELPAFSPYLTQEDLARVQDRQNERRGDLIFDAMDEVKPKKDYKTEVHYEEALERHKKANEEFEEFRKQYAPTYTDALRYLTYHFDNEGGIKSQGLRKAKPSFVERKSRLMKYYESRP